jgi:TRAP-type uncharacterized transport system fused permease subunit
MTSYLTLLLATLGIMIGLFTVTGFINRMGGMLLELGAVHITAVIGMAYIFGWLVGAGLPPTATYIIGAVVIVGPLTKLGVDPWVAHFFVFLISVWGELSPPTSLTAAISARIADASFMRTMWEALKICLPLTLMTFAIFARPEMVTTTGWPQFAAALVVIIGVCGVAFAMFGRTSKNVALDIGLRLVLAVFALVTLMHPDNNLARMTAVVTAIGVLAGVWRHRIVAPPKSTGIFDIEDDETAAPSKLQTAKVNLVSEG